MLRENWKILLDCTCKPERNLTKHYLNKAYVLLLWEVKLLDLWQTTSASSSKLYAYNASMGNSKFNVSDASRLFFSRDFLRAQNMGNENYFDLAGGSTYRGFELPRVKLH